MGILSMGAPVGLMIRFPAVQWIISNFGWRTGWISLGVAGVVIILPISLLVLRRQPEDIGLLPDGDLPEDGSSESRPSGSAAPVEHQWTRAEAIRTVAFWRLTRFFSMFMFTTTTMVFFRIPHFIDNGLSPGLVAVAASSAVMMFVAFYTWAWATNSVGALQGIIYASYFGRQNAGAVRSAGADDVHAVCSDSRPASRLCSRRHRRV
jgi:MFS family permease